MCKLFCVLDVENQTEVEKFIKKAVPYVTKNDNHGMGLMRLGENGIHIQRWLDVPKKLETSPNVTSPYKEMLRLESNEAGKKSNRLDAIALHGRFATCGISLENTHPFYLGGSALMHNGVITNLKEKDNTISTCDSETLLHRYNTYGVVEEPSALSDAMADVTGYYATIVFNDNGVVDIWRDSQADLVLAYVRGIGNVIATNSELIYKTAKACNKKVMFCYPVMSFTHLRWEKGQAPKTMTFDKPVFQTPFTANEKDMKHLEEDHWWVKEALEKRTGRDWDLDDENIERIANLKGV